MTASAADTDRTGLGAYALFAAVLSAAGLPLYMHAPKFYEASYGVSFTALGTVLFALRLIDVVQDPALGWLSQRLQHRRKALVTIGGLVLASGMIGLFAITPLISPLAWFAIMLTCVFSGFSLLTINFYAQGVTKAPSLGVQGYLRLARWRETGALLGVCLAAIAPVGFGALTDAPFVGFAFAFAGLTLLALLAMARHWSTEDLPKEAQAKGGFARVLRDRPARHLLIIALVNAAPVTVSSTLFLYFVESRLEAPGMEGPLLLVFFICAALSSSGWSFIAQRHGTRPVLLAAMALAVVTFGFVFTLGPGDIMGFAIICAVSGATMGADLTLLPAAFARRLEVISPGATEGFGLWAFVSKLTLAFAAVTLLPALDAAGFASGPENTTSALNALTWLYAGVPILLKLVAIGMLCATSLHEERDPWKP